MPGSHQYSNPPAPEWRVPTAPQRSSGQSGVASPPPPPSYNSSNVHGFGYGHSQANEATNTPPIPGFSGVSTASWGVNYNRHNHIPTPPPLPPRPSSTNGQSSNVQSPVVSTTDPYQQSIGAPSYGSQVSYGKYHQQWAPNPPYTSQQPVTSVPPLHPPPPPPPPLPAPAEDGLNYQHPAPPPPTPPQIQQTWHQPPPPSYPTIPQSQYHPPTAVSYQPSPPPPPPPPPSTYPTSSSFPQMNTQQSLFHQETPVSQSLAPTHLPATAPPIPPKASPLIIPTGSSALGTGGPSDWEHFSPIVGDLDDVDVFKPRRDYPAASHDLPPSQSAPAPDVVLNDQSAAPLLSTPTYTSSAVNPATQPYTQQSPVSPGTRQGFHPPAPVRVDTTGSDYSNVSGVANSESIDGLIEAWNQPILSDNKPMPVQQELKIEPDPVSPQRSPSPIAVLPAKQSEPTTSEPIIEPGIKNAIEEPARKTESPRPQSRLVDPYEDLDSWSRSSLERYVAMIRKEAVADSDEERFKIFTTFMAKESKLREILYSIEHDIKDVETKITVETPQKPATPQSPVKQPEQSKSPPVESGLIPVESEYGYFATSGDRDDSLDGSYSPGGRPILPQLHTPQPALHRSASNPGGHKYAASHALSAQALRSTSVPPQINEAPGTALSPLTTNPPQRIYTPFRYTEGPQRGSDKLSINRPAYQAYSALRLASAESGRVMAEAPAEGNRKRSSSEVSMQKDLDETFVGLIREKSVNYRKRPPQTSSPPPLPPSLRQGKPPGPIDNLRAVSASPTNKQSESLWHMTVRKDLEKYLNDFGFVRDTFKSWEAATNARREDVDKERIRRQEDSENHIDELFNEKEIGYADINILEEEFRQTEARMQLEEERGELEDFISNVFNPVDTRLEAEISTLQVHYDSALSQVERDNGKEDAADKHSISHTMKIINEIHKKLEMRHHKRLEIALDRERRRKKAERRPLVFMGDSAALKKLDNEFDQMEKQNILEAARSRDERANKLMDLFDDTIMRGLGENQTLIDDLSNKVTRVDEPVIRSSGLPDAEIEQVLKSIHTLVQSLQKDSESILHSFGVADSALNNADYSVSVAEARYSNAEPDVFRQLDAEKKKEDAKIQENLKKKLQSVRVGPAKITASINGALRTIGKTPFPEQPIPSDVIPASQLYDVALPKPARPASTAAVAATKMDGDPEHRERLRKALEDAKKRNAAKQKSPSTPAPKE
ncbi:hypothetical protein BJX99DRAFT_224804 [Aspergillus californicus]